jgi:hypothetical protein
MTGSNWKARRRTSSPRTARTARSAGGQGSRGDTRLIVEGDFIKQSAQSALNRHLRGGWHKYLKSGG